MHTFLFVDVSLDPNGPGLPFTVKAANIDNACTLATISCVKGRKYKIYYLPMEPGVLPMLGMFIAGDAIAESLTEFWYKFLRDRFGEAELPRPKRVPR